jgi:ribosomal subunit interface protein
VQLPVSGKQIALSDALRAYVSRQLDNITNKYFDHALEAQVTFGRARSFFTCDINLHAGRGVTVRGEGEAGDANTAFDDAAEHIAKRLRRYRKRVNEHARGLNARVKPEPGREYVLREEEFPEVAENAGAGYIDGHADRSQAFEATIIAEGDAMIETLSVRDAVMHMDLAYRQLLMFRNSGNGQLNVVYRRPDGHIGWIDPASGRSIG